MINHWSFAVLVLTAKRDKDLSIFANYINCVVFFCADSKHTNDPSCRKAAAGNDNRKTTGGDGNNKHSSTPQAGGGYSLSRPGREISSIFDIVLWRSHLISSWVLCRWPAAINYHWQDLWAWKDFVLCFSVLCLCDVAPSEIAIPSP